MTPLPAVPPVCWSCELPTSYVKWDRGVWHPYCWLHKVIEVQWEPGVREVVDVAGELRVYLGRWGGDAECPVCRKPVNHRCHDTPDPACPTLVVLCDGSAVKI